MALRRKAGLLKSLRIRTSRLSIKNPLSPSSGLERELKGEKGKGSERWVAIRERTTNQREVGGRGRGMRSALPPPSERVKR